MRLGVELNYPYDENVDKQQIIKNNKVNNTHEQSTTISWDRVLLFSFN